MRAFPLYTGLAVVATAVIWKGSVYFESAASDRSRHYGTPVAVHGAVVVAVGSSFPELSSVVISTLVHGDFSLGVGGIVGSAIFNLPVIPVGVILAGSATINFPTATPTMGFLALATIVFVVFTRTDLDLTDLEATGFLALYAVFLVWMTLETTGAIETVRGV